MGVILIISSFAINGVSAGLFWEDSKITVNISGVVLNVPENFTIYGNPSVGSATFERNSNLQCYITLVQIDNITLVSQYTSDSKIVILK